MVVAGCQNYEAGAEAPSTKPMEVVAVHMKPAERRTIAQVVQALGTCETLLNKTAVLTPAIEGQVLDILAKPGDAVKAGQPIVQLDPRLAEANLNEKKATRDGLMAALDLLKATPRPEEQKNCQLAIDDAKVGVQKATATIERLQPLLEHGDIPRQQIFDAKLALDQARLQQQKAETQLRVLMMGPRPEAIKEAEDHLAAAEMAVATAQSQRDLLTIRSPIGGVVERITCRLGQTLTVGTPLGEVADTRQLYAMVWLPPRDARLVRPGQEAKVHMAESSEAPSPQGKEKAEMHSGRVEFVGQTVDPQTGNFPVRVLFDNTDRRVGLGQTVTVAITVRQKSDALVVPAEAVFDLEGGPALNVVRNEKSVVLHPRLGLTTKDWVEVEGTDLSVGEPVIVEGAWGLSDGTMVKAKAEAGDQTPHAAKPVEGKP